jgi:hypothetical protein
LRNAAKQLPFLPLKLIRYFASRIKQASMTSIQRKENSEALLATLGITLNDQLPLIEETALSLRSPQEIAQRILIITYLNCVATDPSLQQEVMMFLIREKLWDHATDTEKALFHKPQLTDEDIDNIYWRKESIWMLLWVIGEVDEAGLPDKEVEIYEIFPLLPGFFDATGDYVRNASMRDDEEILSQNDFAFRLSWALSIEKLIPTIPLNESVAHERSFSMRWVTGMGEWG